MEDFQKLDKDGNHLLDAQEWTLSLSFGEQPGTELTWLNCLGEIW